MSFTEREQTLGLSPHLPWSFVPQPGLLSPPTLPWMALAYLALGEWLVLCGLGHLLANTTWSPQAIALPCPLLRRATQPHLRPASEAGRACACMCTRTHTGTHAPSLSASQGRALRGLLFINRDGCSPVSAKAGRQHFPSFHHTGKQTGRGPGVYPTRSSLTPLALAALGAPCSQEPPPSMGGPCRIPGSTLWGSTPQPHRLRTPL